jgi:hypothetical protein
VDKLTSTAINSKNIKTEKIKSRITAGNRWFYSLAQIFRPRAISKAVKIKIYNKMVEPVAVCESEKWPVTEMDIKRMNTWDRASKYEYQENSWE